MQPNRRVLTGTHFEMGVEDVIGSILAKDPIVEVEGIEAASKPFGLLSSIKPQLVADIILGEHPQTIAMIMAYLPAEISSEIMMSLPDERKGDIAVRIARLVAGETGTATDPASPVD